MLKLVWWWLCLWSKR